MPEKVLYDQCALLIREDGSLYELGSGRGNTTYKGFDLGLQLPVALKIIPADCFAEEGARERFEAAAQTALELRHRHVAAIYQFGEDGGKCFYTMEFVEGESLEVVLKREGHLRVARALDIVAQATEALCAAQILEIVHGDLRPAKLMLANDDEDETVVKILDYGLARRSLFRGTAGREGKPAEVSDYASPEQRLGQQIDVRSDIYSLGLIFWEMLTGQKGVQPIPDARLGERIQAATETLIQLLCRMLQPDPALRPQTPAELQAEIDGCFESRAGASTMEPEPAPPPRAEPTTTLPPLASPPPPPPSPQEAATVAPREMEIRGADPPIEWYDVDESPTQRRPEGETAAITLAEEPPPEAPPSFSEAETEVAADAEAVTKPLKSPSYVIPEPGTGWQTTQPGRSGLRNVTTVALFVIALVAGYLGYESYLRYSTTEPIQSATVGPVQPATGEPIASTTAKATEPPVATREPQTPVEQVPGGEAPRRGDAPNTGPKVSHDDLKSSNSMLPTASINATTPGSITPALPVLKPQTPMPVREPTPSTTPPPTPPSTALSGPSSTSVPASATKKMPFVNSLGQPYVPVPGTNVLFCRWDTRVCDWEAFIKEAGDPTTPGMNVVRVKKEQTGDWDTDYDVDKKATWKDPGFVQTGEHPVVGVNWNDANRFCAWLSKKESRTYRLPTDAEWSAAVGRRTYPWGEVWPPPKGAGNYWDEAAVANLPGGVWPTLPGNDEYANTSPVGKFNENPLGLYDMGGNIWQWCEDEYRESMNEPGTLLEKPWLKKAKDKKGVPSRVLRGASWFDASRVYLRSSFREWERLTTRGSDIGFRCVLDLREASASLPR